MQRWRSARTMTSSAETAVPDKDSCLRKQENGSAKMRVDKRTVAYHYVFTRGDLLV